MLEQNPQDSRGEQTAGAAGRPTKRKPRRGLPLSLVMVGGVIGLMVSAMALVIGLTFAASLRNTTDLLIFSSQFLVEALENRIEAELAPAALLAKAAASVAAGPVATTGAEPAMSAQDMVVGAMAVLPQAAAVVLEARLGEAVQEGGPQMVLRNGWRPAPGQSLEGSP